MPVAATEPTFSTRRTITIFFIAAALLALAAWQVIVQLQPRLAQRYIERGVTYLQSQNYDAATLEFTKAQNSRAPEAAHWLELTNDVVTDPKVLESYWRQWHVDVVTRKLDEAAGPFASPKDALAEAIKLYSTHDAPYAQYAVDQAILMDPNYPEAWQYRYLIDTELAKQSTKYRELADQAKAKRDSLTSLYLNP